MLGSPDAGLLVQTHWNPVVPFGESHVALKDVSSPLRTTLTSADWTKPGRSPAVEEYVAWSTKYASSAVAALRQSLSARASKPLARYAANCGMAIAAKIPMMATTTRSSIRVKPD